MMKPESTSQAVRQIDVARKAGLSQRTVSAVLGSSTASRSQVSESTARRIRKIASQMGYRPYLPAQQMKGKRSGIIGVLVGAAEVEVNTSRLMLIERLARASNYRLMVGHLHDLEHFPEYVEDFLASGVDGILCLRHDLGPADAVPKRLRGLRNVVYLDRPAGVDDASWVALDRSHGIRQAYTHLYQSGRRRIGMILCEDAANMPMRDRLTGYKQAMADLSLPLDERLLWITPGTLTMQSPELDDAVDTLVVKQKADAIIASNDAVATTVLKRIKARKLRVPQDVALVGYDNLSLGQAVEPELTTIDHQNQIIAMQLMDILLKLISQQPLATSERQVTIQPRLVLRQSS